MSALVGLLGFCVLASVCASRWLADAPWTHQAPALAICVWQAVTFSVAGAVVLAGTALMLPMLHLSADLAELFRACVAGLRHHYETPAGAGLALAGGVTAAAVPVRFVHTFASLQGHAWSTRRSIRSTLHLVGVHHPALGFVELDHGVPLVYCVPVRLRDRLVPRWRAGAGSPGRDVVVTRGALEALTFPQLEGVLAHERAHLRSRHHLAITASRALETTFFSLGVFRLAADRIAQLAEMHADDGARDGLRHHLAAALLRLGTVGAPAGAMGAGGHTARARIRRLAEPANPLQFRGMATVAGLVLSLAIVPLALALVPTVLTRFLDCCGSAGAFTF